MKEYMQYENDEESLTDFWVKKLDSELPEESPKTTTEFIGGGEF